MTKKPSVYLAGGMEKAGEYGKIWRDQITPPLEERGFYVVNPYKEEINVGINVSGLKEIKETDFKSYLNYCGKIVDYDIKRVSVCSLVIARIDESVLKGAGTFGEITYSKVKGIPVIGWIDLPKGVKAVPGWAVGCLSEYTEGSMSDLISLLDGNNH